MKDPNNLFIQDYKEETARIVVFIRRFFSTCPRKKVILGLSGGIDSAVVASLCCNALDPKNVYVVMMPAPNSSKKSRDDAFTQTKSLGILDENIYYRPLQRLLETFGFNERELEKGNLIIGNTSARLRMVILFKIADEVGAVVSGTENKVEHLLGYFTIGGDAVSIIEPIHHLFKREVKKLAEYLGVVPEILNKPPSAELWNGQTDEGELGFFYDDADVILRCLEQGDILMARNHGIEQEIIDKVNQRRQYSEFKRQVPYCLHS